MIGCLQTRAFKQPIIVIYFEFENELKFYSLKPWSQYLESRTQYCESGKSCHSPTRAVVTRKHNAWTMLIVNIRLDYCVCELYTNAIHIITRRVGLRYQNRKFIYYAFLSASYVTSLKCYSYKYHFDWQQSRQKGGWSKKKQKSNKTQNKDGSHTRVH